MLLFQIMIMVYLNRFMKYTVNNKKIEIAVKQIVSGTAINPSGTVANPDSLKLYHKYYHLESVIGREAKESAKL